MDGILLRVLDQLILMGADEIEIAIWPGAQVESYEVGVDTAELFTRSLNSLSTTSSGEALPGLKVVEKVGASLYANIPNLLISQAISKGVSSAQIYRTPLCTIKNEKKYFSHRREKNLSGRQLSFLGPWSLK